MNKELIAKAFALADGLDAATAPGPVSECLRELALQNEQLREALDEWFEKTEWVQARFSISELFCHRADVLRNRIEALENERTALQIECGTLQRAIVSLQKEVGQLKSEPKPEQPGQPTDTARPQQHESHRLAYPGGGAALFNKLWHLTLNCVATQNGNYVRTDLLPMQEMREFLESLCCLVDSPPICEQPAQPEQHPDTARLDWLARNPVEALEIFGGLKTERDVQEVRKDIDSAIAAQEEV